MTTSRIQYESLISFFNRNSDTHRVTPFAISTLDMLNIVLHEDLPGYLTVLDVEPDQNVQTGADDD